MVIMVGNVELEGVYVGFMYVKLQKEITGTNGNLSISSANDRNQGLPHNVTSLWRFSSGWQGKRGRRTMTFRKAQYPQICYHGVAMDEECVDCIKHFIEEAECDLSILKQKLQHLTKAGDRQT